MGRALRKDHSKDFLMSTGKNILTMSALVSKCDFTLEVLKSETPDARDKGRMSWSAKYRSTTLSVARKSLCPWNGVEWVSLGYI